MITIALITISDRSFRGEREDKSGVEIRKWADEKGFKIIAMSIIPDEKEEIKNKIIEYTNLNINLIVTTGGTGLSPRDVTPEATLSVIDKEIPGFAEVMRRKSHEITPHAMLSRGVSGIRKQSLIINLPGSPKAVRENLLFIEDAIPHAVDLLNGNVSDCSSN